MKQQVRLSDTAGKVVKDTALTDEGDLLITFTDRTFCYVSSSVGEDYVELYDTPALDPLQIDEEIILRLEIMPKEDLFELIEEKKDKEAAMRRQEELAELARLKRKYGNCA